MIKIEDGERRVTFGPGGVGFTGIFSTGWTPPDPHMGVGPDHVVVMTNGAIAFFTKDGTLTFQDEIEDTFGFWGEVGATFRLGNSSAAVDGATARRYLHPVAVRDSEPHQGTTRFHVILCSKG